MTVWSFRYICGAQGIRQPSIQDPYRINSRHAAVKKILPSLAFGDFPTLHTVPSCNLKPQDYFFKTLRLVCHPASLARFQGGLPLRSGTV
jgi:hypothetical protein